MTAGRAREARDLAAHRDRIEASLQGISNGAAQRANFPDPGRRCWGRTIKHEKRRALAPCSPRKYSTVSSQREPPPDRARQSAERHENTCKLLIYKCFSLRKFSSICCRHGAKPLCGALDVGCPQSYPQFLWVNMQVDGALQNVTICDAVAVVS